MHETVEDKYDIGFICLVKEIDRQVDKSTANKANWKLHHVQVRTSKHLTKFGLEPCEVRGFESMIATIISSTCSSTIMRDPSLAFAQKARISGRIRRPHLL